MAVGMMNAVGIETVWARTAKLAEAFRQGCVELGMSVFSKQPSDSVTAILLPEGVTDKQFRGTLRDRYGASVAGGQDELKDRAFRVSHMGYIDAIETLGLIGAIERTLIDCGAAIDPGTGLAAASKVLD